MQTGVWRNAQPHIGAHDYLVSTNLLSPRRFMLNSRLLPAADDPLHFVVLLHAFPLSTAMWDRMAVELESIRDDTTLLLVDLPGFGESPLHEGWTMKGIAKEIREAILVHTPDRIILGGLSMGGYAAFAFYREYPSMLRGIVLSNTKAEVDSEEAKAYRAEFAADALARGADAAIDRLYSKFVTEDTDAEIAIDIRSWMSEAQPRAIADALGAMAAREDSTDLLKLISIPALVISGSEDETIAAEIQRKMAKELHGATYVEMNGAAHLTASERPLEWAEAFASFLDRV